MELKLLPKSARTEALSESDCFKVNTTEQLLGMMLPIKNNNLASQPPRYAVILLFFLKKELISRIRQIKPEMSKDNVMQLHHAAFVCPRRGICPDSINNAAQVFTVTYATLMEPFEAETNESFLS